MEPDDRESDAAKLESAFEHIGMSVEVREELQALTASAEGGAIFALIVAGPAGFLARLGQLQAERVDKRFRSAIARAHEHGRQVLAREEAIEAIIEPDLPAKAYRQLKDVPSPPSGRVIWDSAASRWRDWLEETDE